MNDYREFYERHLPHWQPEGATLFVTCRLAGSLPRAKIAELQAQRQVQQARLAQIDDTEERNRRAYQTDRHAFGQWDHALHCTTYGPHWLSEPQIANIVVEALHYRDDRVFDLLAYCLMPNHMHLVIAPQQRADGTYHILSHIMQSLKRNTARRANQMLGRQGPFWQAESYDHVVRDNEELTRIVRYVLNNPVKANLVEEWESWPWNYCKK